MPVPLQQPSPWDQFGTGIGDALIGVNQPFGSLAPMDPAARQSAIRSGALNLGMGMLANSRQAPMEALSGAYGQAREAGGVAQAGNMRMQQAQMEMENAKRSRALQESQYAQEQEYKAKQQAALQSFIESPPEGTDPQIIRGVGLLVQSGMYDKALELATKSAGGGGSKFGLQPMFRMGEDGKLHAYQLNEGGGASEIHVPGGGDWTRGVQNLDLGPEFQPTDRLSGQPRGEPIQKDLRGAEAEKQIGEGLGRQAAAASGDVAAGNLALDVVTKIENDPYLERGTGLSSMGNVIPGTGGYDLQNLVNQAKSGAFLTAIQQMRGLGSLSNAEGDTATKALQRMDTATSKEAFMSALNDYKNVIRLGVARAQKRANTYGLDTSNTAVPPKTDFGGGGNAPEGIDDPSLWEYLTPEEKKLWQ